MGPTMGIAVTLANSIIGVSILAMPFCMKQCGIVLGSIMLALSALITRFTCHLLLKSAQSSRKRTYELVAQYTYGSLGKIVAEISIIGFNFGILISFFVVMGDLGTPIVAAVFNIETSSLLRIIVLLGLGFGVALPLSLLKDVESLSGLSTVSFIFYTFLILKEMGEALPVLVSENLFEAMNMWNVAGVFQGLPIYALSLSCQTQIFGIYDCLPDPSLKKMNMLIKIAVSLCTALYFFVGFFGYLAFCNQDISGNILLNFSPGFMTEAIKFCFLLSLVFSVPLIVFPCRASIFSLLFKKHNHVVAPIEVGSIHIPESIFKAITIHLIIFTLVLGIICPNIETVLGLLGSTIGIIICIVLPTLMFIQLTPKHTFENWGAKFVCLVGLILLLSCTWAMLKPKTYSSSENSYEEDPMADIIGADKNNPPVLHHNDHNDQNVLKDNVVVPSTTTTMLPREKSQLVKLPVTQKPLVANKNGSFNKHDERQEPPEPQEPDDGKKDSVAMNNNLNEDAIRKEQKEIRNVKIVNDKNVPEIDSDKVDAEEHSKEENIAQKQEELLKLIEEQQEEQKKILEQQRHILEELKAHGKSHGKEADDLNENVNSANVENANAKVLNIKDSDKGSNGNSVVDSKKVEEAIIAAEFKTTVKVLQTVDLNKNENLPLKNTRELLLAGKDKSVKEDFEPSPENVVEKRSSNTSDKIVEVVPNTEKLMKTSLKPKISQNINMTKITENSNEKPVEPNIDANIPLDAAKDENQKTDAKDSIKVINKKLIVNNNLTDGDQWKVKDES